MPVAKKAAAKAAPAKATKAAPAKAAAKATPAKASRKSAAVADDDEPDLLAAMNDTSAASTVDDDEDFDLLSDLTEDEGTPWIPWDDEDQPEGIQGRVTTIGEVEREQKYGGGSALLIVLEEKNGDVWSVRGYSTVLANRLEREVEKGLKVGDTLAIKYLGEKENKKGDNAYKNFATAFKAR